MSAVQPVASARGESKFLRLVLKAIVLAAFGVALVALARGPVKAGGDALAPPVDAGQPTVKSDVQPGQTESPERTRYFPAEFPDVRGETQPTPDTF